MNGLLEKYELKLKSCIDNLTNIENDYDYDKASQYVHNLHFKLSLEIELIKEFIDDLKSNL